MAAHLEDELHLGGGYRPEAPAVPDPRRRGRAFVITVLQFFLFPLAIVALCTALFVGARWMTYERTTPMELIRRIDGGGASVKWLPSQKDRWQAAFELYGKLANMDPEDRDPKLAREAIRVFEKPGQDPAVRRYLAGVLGLLRTRESAPPLADALAKDPDPEVRFHAAIALGEVGDEGAVDGLIAALDDSDAGVRMVSAFALARLGDARAVDPLRSRLEDADENVRWNAALALASLGNPGGEAVLRRMMDRLYISGVVMGRLGAARSNLAEDQIASAMTSAIRGVVRLGDVTFAADLRRLADADASLRVRQEAMRALREMGL